MAKLMCGSLAVSDEPAPIVVKKFLLALKIKEIFTSATSEILSFRIVLRMNLVSYGNNKMSLILVFHFFTKFVVTAIKILCWLENFP